ncbi:MAG: hypothetical protein JOZ58_22790 [Acetobacteraceae bacterium]|nr:hypothetical protein [Acetobacteraceae bacterium]
MSAEASIRGRPVSLDEAVREAASILSASRSAVIAGMLTDVAGTEAALALAAAIGAAVDHAHAAAAFRNLDVMREAGWIVTTPLEVCARADLVVLVGPGLDSTWPGYAAKLRLREPPPLKPESARRIVRLCLGNEPSGADAMTINCDLHELPILLGSLRALYAGHAIRDQTPKLPQLHKCAQMLREAAYGAVLWSAQEMSGLAIEMLCGLIDDLNRTTRFAALPLAPSGNAIGVAEACAWTCGFPFRTSFARGSTEHDPWRYDAARMVVSGEADSAVWIAATESLTPAWDGAVPAIAIVAPGTEFRTKPAVQILVGRPGIDHSAVLFDPDCATLVAKPAPRGELPTVAEVLRLVTDVVGVR